MKILEIKNLPFQEIKVIRYGKFPDKRGYFAETFRVSDVEKMPELNFLKGNNFAQINESYAVKGVIKGMHFQWEPPMGKLVRMVKGHMLDMVMDIRKNSPTFGKIILYEMKDNLKEDFGEWIWVPFGFAHGMLFLEESIIEYFFTADYNPKAEAGIHPLSKDIDWSLCDLSLKEKFNEYVKNGIILSDRDQQGLSLENWKNDTRSNNITYAKN